MSLPIDLCVLPRLLALLRDHGKTPPSRSEALALLDPDPGVGVCADDIVDLARTFDVSLTHILVPPLETTAAPPIRFPALILFKDGATALLDEIDVSEAACPRFLIREDSATGEPPSAQPLSLTGDDLRPLWDGDLLAVLTG